MGLRAATLDKISVIGVGVVKLLLIAVTLLLIPVSYTQLDVYKRQAVIQGLSEMPAMQDVENWAVLTIGTGLGNASYRKRAKPGSTGRD